MRIKTKTRKNIADTFVVEKIKWSGRLTEVDFLSRLFDIKSMPSNDPRYSTAYGDINMHRNNFIDWDDDWVFTDNRFGLLNADDTLFIDFICEILNPAVRPDDSDEETQKILDIFNEALKDDGLILIPVPQKYGKSKYQISEIDSIREQISERTGEIVEYLNSEYISKQIEKITTEIEESPYEAIGKSKELIETICKTIIKRKGESFERDWNIAKLVKTANSLIEFVPEDLPEKDKADKSIKMILSGMSTSIHGLTELRNAYGSGHGHDSDFIGLETKHAKLCVGFTIEILQFYLEALQNSEILELYKEE